MLEFVSTQQTTLVFRGHETSHGDTAPFQNRNTAGQILQETIFIGNHPFLPIIFRTIFVQCIFLTPKCTIPSRRTNKGVKGLWGTDTIYHNFTFFVFVSSIVFRTLFLTHLKIHIMNVKINFELWIPKNSPGDIYVEPFEPKDLGFSSRSPVTGRTPFFIYCKTPPLPTSSYPGTPGLALGRLLLPPPPSPPSPLPSPIRMAPCWTRWWTASSGSPPRRSAGWGCGASPPTGPAGRGPSTGPGMRPARHPGSPATGSAQWPIKGGSFGVTPPLFKADDVSLTQRPLHGNGTFPGVFGEARCLKRRYVHDTAAMTYS